MSKTKPICLKQISKPKARKELYMPDLIDLRFTTIQRPLPDFIYEQIQSYVTKSNTYHRQPEELIERLAKKHDVPAENIFLTAGADQAIQLILQKYGQHTHVFTPSYIGYSDARAFGYDLTEQYSLRGGVYEIDTSKHKEATLIALANPNNPAGVTQKGRVVELVDNNSHALVMVDEAYGDFADVSVIDEVKSRKNLVVVKSFSKSHALAGFRVGYMIASKEIIDELFLETTYFNVPYPSVGAAMVALDNEAYFKDVRDKIIQQRVITEKALRGAGFSVVASGINAALIKLGSDKEAKDVFDRLEQKGILVSRGGSVNNIGLRDNFIRMCIAEPNQMDEVIAAIS